MKALSIKQPFAELILMDKKKIELRNWNTGFRGEFLIHASKVPDENAMKRFGFDDLPCGCIVGKAELIDVNKYKSRGEYKKDRDKHLSSSFYRYGFILKNVKRVGKIPCKGRLGFWDFD